MRVISEIIVHCSATRADWMDTAKTSAKVAEIKRWHTDPKSKKGRGWKDIGYHYLIDRDGTLAKGRPVATAGAHTLGHNANSIGVCLLGGHGSSEKDKFEDNFTAAQDQALRDFIADQKRQFPSINKISGHNEYAAKACPGFSVADWFNSEAPASLANLAQPKTDALASVADARFDKFYAFLVQLAQEAERRLDGLAIETNMGISRDDLANWRKVDLAALEENALQFLSPAEAKQIYRTRFYAACRCSEMPDRMAMVVFDAAAQFGSNHAVKFVQKAFNSLGLTVDGESLVVDGLIGRLTIGAVKQTDPSVLADAFLDEVEAYLHTQSDAETELNRISALREFINTLPKGSGVRPSMKMKVLDKDFDVSDLLDIAGSAQSGDTKTALTKVAGLLLEEDADDSASRSRKKALARLLLGVNDGAPIPSDVPATITKGPGGEPPLTPVNAALGTTIGRALNGKKSVSGIIGLLLTTVLPQLGIQGDIVTFLVNNSSTLVTVFSLLTGWGFLGKMDKAIRLMGMVSSRK